MLSIVRKFILLLLIAGIPLQGAAMQSKMVAHQDRLDHVVSAQDNLAEEHGFCTHDMPNHDESTGQKVPAGDCSHCPLCVVPPMPPAALALQQHTASIQHPAPQSYISIYYPELPQRPPLSRLP